MNAKELRAAANDIRARCKAAIIDSGWVHEEDKQALKLAEHILSTVREDDDEPVTVERLVALGGERDEDDMPGDEFQHVWFGSRDSMRRDHLITFRRHGDEIRLYSWNSRSEIDGWLLPRNMKEARELFVRCWAIEGAK